MIWALLFSLIFGGSDNVLINPKSKKHVKKHVIQKETRKEILDIINNYEKDAKKFNKVKKKRKKEMYQMNSDRSVKGDDFREFFKAYMEERKLLDAHALESGIQVRVLISDEEWVLILADAETDYLKRQDKREKKIRQLRKAFRKVEKAIDKSISEGERISGAKHIIQIYKNAVIKIQGDYDNFNYRDNKILSNRNASREELQNAQSTVDVILWELFEAYTKTHVDMVDITTEEEWQKIQKSNNKIY